MTLAVVASRFNDANRTGNYSVLRDLASPGFREANTSAKLAEIFQDLRHRGIDLAPIVLFQPKLKRKPWIDDRGRLNLTGFFTTRPEQVEFDLAFEAVNDRWRLFGIRVGTQKVVEVGAAGGVAPGEPAPANVETVAKSDQSGSAVMPTPRPAQLMPPSGEPIPLVQ